MKTLFKWSVADYHRIVDSGILNNRSVELLEGDIVEMSPEKPLHSSTNDNVAEYLRELLRGIARIREAHPITLDNSEPEPDLAIVGLSDNNYRDRHPYPQDIYWLIEVANSTLDDDLNRKKIIYARNQIPEYWVIDLQNNKLWLFRYPQNNDYVMLKELTTGTIIPLAFPNITVDVSNLLIC